MDTFDLSSFFLRRISQPNENNNINDKSSLKNLLDSFVNLQQNSRKRPVINNTLKSTPVLQNIAESSLDIKIIDKNQTLQFESQHLETIKKQKVDHIQAVQEEEKEKEKEKKPEQGRGRGRPINALYIKEHYTKINPFYCDVDCKINNNPLNNVCKSRYLSEKLCQDNDYLYVLKIEPIYVPNQPVPHYRVVPQYGCLVMPEKFFAFVGNHDKTSVAKIKVMSNDYMNGFRGFGKFDQSALSTKKPSPDKQLVNNHVLCALQDNPRQDRKIIYLEGPHGFTTKVLYDSGFSCDDLLAVNANPIFSKPNHPIFKKASVFQCLMYEMIRDIDVFIPSRHDKTPVLFQYDLLLDYCCSFYGNDVCNPCNDIKLALFRKLLPFKNGILWLTFCLRNSNKKFNEVIDDIYSFINEQGVIYGYKFSVIKTGQYGRANQIFFIIYKTV